MVDRGKVGSDVSVDDPKEFLSLRGAPLPVSYRIHGASGWAEAQGVWTKVRVADRRQDHSSGCVSHPILQGRHPQGACLAVRFGDVPPSDGGRRARCRLSCLGDSRELLCQVFIDDGHGNAVTSRRHTTRVLCDGVLSPSAPRPVLP